MSWVVKTLSKSKITINFSSQNTGTSVDWAISDGRDDVTVTVVTFNFRKWNVVSAATSAPPMKSTRINCMSRSKSFRWCKNIGSRNTPPDLALQLLYQFCCLLIEPKKHLQKKNTLTCLRWVLRHVLAWVTSVFRQDDMLANTTRNLAVYTPKSLMNGKPTKSPFFQ